MTVYHEFMLSKRGKSANVTLILVGKEVVLLPSDKKLDCS